MYLRKLKSVGYCQKVVIAYAVPEDCKWGTYDLLALTPANIVASLPDKHRTSKYKGKHYKDGKNAIISFNDSLQYYHGNCN